MKVEQVISGILALGLLVLIGVLVFRIARMVGF